MNHSRQHKHVIAIALPFALLIGASAACAAEPEVAPRQWVPKPAATTTVRRAPAVYGWSYRAPRSATIWNGCGVYRYWNGTECVDARDVPPTY
jgi:hypothetical protein